MAKIDLKKDLKQLYNPTLGDVTLIDVPQMNFVMIEGQGAPESPQFQKAIEALYTVAYTIKFDTKKADGTDFVVMPLEGLWWSDDPATFDPEKGDRNKWHWTLLIMQPAFITREIFEKARESSKKKRDNSDIDKVKFEKFIEGSSAQIMYIGPFKEEGPTVKRIHKKIAEAGGKPVKKHHEIYLSDFRKVDPAKMKTVIRQPYSLTSA